MKLITGKIEIKVFSDFTDQSQTVTVDVQGSDEDLIEGFYQSMTTDSRIKNIFNQAVRKANARKISDQN